MRNVLSGLSKTVGALALAAGLFAGPAAAITINFEVFDAGTFGVAPEFTNGANPGDLFSLSFDAVPDTPSDPNNLVTTANSLSLNINGTVLDFTQPGNTTIRVTDGGGSDTDEFALDYNGTGTINGVASTTFFAYAVTLRFTDTDGDAFLTPDLPTSFDFALFEERSVVIQAFGLGSEFLRGNAVSAIPLPAAFPLLLSALGGFGFVAWRRRKTV